MCFSFSCINSASPPSRCEVLTIHECFPLVLKKQKYSWYVDRIIFIRNEVQYYFLILKKNFFRYFRNVHHKRWELKLLRYDTVIFKDPSLSTLVNKCLPLQRRSAKLSSILASMCDDATSCSQAFHAQGQLMPRQRLGRL